MRGISWIAKQDYATKTAPPIKYINFHLAFHCGIYYINLYSAFFILCIAIFLVMWNNIIKAMLRGLNCYKLKNKNLVKNDTVGFIWVTDGEGWLTAKRPLSETFIVTDYVMNINIIEQGLLEEIVTKGL